MTTHSETLQERSRAASAAQWTARVALVYSAIVLVLMLINAVAARSAHPIEVASLEALQHDLTVRPDDEGLRRRVRQEDKRIRQQYFRHRDFAVRGAWLLLAGIATFLAAGEYARRFQTPMPTPRPDAASRARAAADATFRALVAVGGVLAGALLTLTVLARHDTAAEYVRAASRSHTHAAGMMPGGLPPTTGQQAATGLPVATGPGLASPVSGSTGMPTPQPSGGRLSGPGTVMVPLRVASKLPTPAGGVASELLRRPLPKVEPSAAPGWERNWPRFRGPAGTGIAFGANPPLQWNGQTGEGILWKTKLPLPGWNSPVVWEGRIICSGADETHREVYCLDLSTGAVVWKTSVPSSGGAAPKVQADTGYAPSTLATDGARIVAVFVNGDVACLDMSGKLLWKRSFGPLENPYGHASSPVIFGSGVILQLDQGHGAEDGKSALLALDLVSGKTVWQIQRPVGASWSTPILITVNGKEQLVTTANPWVIAYDPHDGTELWRAECLGGEVAVSPVTAQGYVVVANQGSNSAAIRPDGRGDVSKVAVAWTAGDGLPDIVSPLAFQDLILLVTTEGFLTCVETKSGKRVWEEDLGVTVRASPVLAGGRVYLLDASGTMHILQPGRTFKLMARCPLGEAANATPAFVADRIVIRTRQHIVCVGTR